MNDLSLQDLNSQLELSNNLLGVANTELEKLRSKANFSSNQQYQNYKSILSENHLLLNEHQNNVKDITNYKNQINELQQEISKNENLIASLTKENEMLKMKHKEKSEQNQQKNIIKGVEDIRKSFGFNLKKQEKKTKENNQEIIKEEKNEGERFLLSEERKKEFEKLKTKKLEKENTLRINKETIINYAKRIEVLKTYVENYFNYINSINEQIRALNQQTKVSVIGEEQMNFYKSCGEKLKQLTKEMEEINSLIKQVRDAINSIEIRTLKKAENIITNIESKFAEINNNTNLDYYFLFIRMDSILSSSDNLDKIVKTLNQEINSIIEQSNKITKGINDLQINIQNFIGSFQEGKKKLKEAIKKTLRKTGKNIFNSINKSIRNEKVDKNEEIIDKINEEPEEEKEFENSSLKISTLIGVKDFKKNIDLFKSTILFKDQNIEQEKNMKEEKLLRKNWHEICYIYDDYDIHFELKAVGLGAFSFFNSCSLSFYLGKIIEILELEVNGKKANYTFDDYLDFDIHLNNLETAKVYLKYKERPKFEGKNDKEKKSYFLYRKEYYGLSPTLRGQIGKFSLILKGSMSIINFKEDFFIPNENNKKEKEYVWGGKVPPEGKMTVVTLTKNEATWKFYSKYELISN